MNIATLDWVVIGAYFVIITAIGLIVGLPGPPDRRVLPRRAAVRPLADDGPELRRRHPRRDAGGPGRRGLQRRRVRHLVPVEEPLHHAVLLADGPGLPAHPPHDDGGARRGSLRAVDGRPLHRVRALLLHHQHRQHAERGRQGHQPGDRRRRRRQRDRRGHDRHVHGSTASSAA